MLFIVLAAESLGTLKVCLVGDMSSFLLSIFCRSQSCCWLLLLSGGMLLLELNRLLRPGGYFVWSATPVYQKLPEDVQIWNGIAVTASLFHPNWMQFFIVYISKEHTIILQEHCISINRVAYRHTIPFLVRRLPEIFVQTLKHIMKWSQYCLYGTLATLYFPFSFSNTTKWKYWMILGIRNQVFHGWSRLAFIQNTWNVLTVENWSLRLTFWSLILYSHVHSDKVHVLEDGQQD